MFGLNFFKPVSISRSIKEQLQNLIVLNPKNMFSEISISNILKYAFVNSQFEFIIKVFVRRPKTIMYNLAFFEIEFQTVISFYVFEIVKWVTYQKIALFKQINSTFHNFIITVDYHCQKQQFNPKNCCAKQYVNDHVTKEQQNEHFYERLEIFYFIAIFQAFKYGDFKNENLY